MKQPLLVFAAFLLLTVGLLTAGCSSGSGTQPTSVPVVQPATLSLNTDTILKVGETRRIENTQTNITFVSVDKDSRCPIDANCISAGEFDAKLLVTSGSGANGESYILSETPSNLLIPATQNHAAYTVSLRFIDPSRQSTVTIDPADYKITVQVSPQTEVQGKSAQK